MELQNELAELNTVLSQAGPVLSVSRDLLERVSAKLRDIQAALSPNGAEVRCQTCGGTGTYGAPNPVSRLPTRCPRCAGTGKQKLHYGQTLSQP